MLLKDKKLKEFFTEHQIKIMAEVFMTIEKYGR